MRNNENTIFIPSDENWIVQGQLGADGIPIKLDARFSSGTPLNPSEANVVVRHVRFSMQSAPLDPAAGLDRQDAVAGVLVDVNVEDGAMRNGGAFKYDGGGLVPDQRTPRLIFEQVVFDHNEAVCGGALFIQGRVGTVSAIELIMDGCLLYRNVAHNKGGGLWFVDQGPQTVLINNTDFNDNKNLQFDAHWFVAYYEKKTGVVGVRDSITIANAQHRGNYGASSVYYRQYSCDMAHVAPIGVVWNWHGGFVWTNPTAERGDVMTTLTFIRLKWEDLDFCKFPAISIWGTKLAVKYIDCTVARSSGSGFVGPYGGGGIGVINSNQAPMLGPIEFLHFTAEDNENGVGYPDAGALAIQGGSTQYTRLMSSRFVRNKADYGGAVSFSGEGDFIVIQCTFISNGAIIGGGAIHVSAGLGKFLVEASVFYNNVVVAPPDATLDYVLRMYDAGATYMQSNDAGYNYIPIWRIDSGPQSRIYGAPWEICEGARRASEAGVARGLAPSWPSETPCANVTLGRGTISAKTVTLSQGDHILYAGLIYGYQALISGWQNGGWIDIVGLVDRVYPTKMGKSGDDRGTVRYPGCSAVETSANPCPRGDANWRDIPFHVGVGRGGAIMTADSKAAIVIADAVFRDNIAASVYRCVRASRHEHNVRRCHQRIFWLGGRRAGLPQKPVRRWARLRFSRLLHVLRSVRC
jgi:hypothetical protein